MSDTRSLAPLRVSLAQLNPTVGAVEHNARLLLDHRQRVFGEADIILTSELYLTGYPPEDLVLKPFFLEEVRARIDQLVTATADGGPAILLGAPVAVEDQPDAAEIRGRPANAALLIADGTIKATVHKHHLPNYGVFDEKRVFKPGQKGGLVDFRGWKLGIAICEDIWYPDVLAHLAGQGADAFLIPNASPFEGEKVEERIRLVRQRVAETGQPLLYLNQVGGQDDLVFDGASFVVDAQGRCTHHLGHFTQDTGVVVTLEPPGEGQPARIQSGPQPCAEPDRLEAMWRAMCLGLGDYVEKNRFPGVVLGLSGGIDSALTAACAVDALGADKVHCVMMPSPYTSPESLEDAAACARQLGVRLDEVAILPAMGAMTQMLSPLFEGREPDLTEENIQSRLRGLILMSLSNKFGPMLLTTGNKSEMAVGYATLYGDMCGGYSVLKDVYKTDVFALSRWRNQGCPAGLLGPDGPVMPDRVITKPPSAELRPDQKDEDSLPPYDVLDDILQCLVEHELGLEDITARGHPADTVSHVWRLLDRAEYKRRQSPPGVKISRRAFGRERRYPITSGFQTLMRQRGPNGAKGE